jgi:hypothetical protein
LKAINIFQKKETAPNEPEAIKMMKAEFDKQKPRLIVKECEINDENTKKHIESFVK